MASTSRPPSFWHKDDHVERAGPQALESALARIADQCHDKPAEHEEMLGLGTANVSLERVEHWVYFAWDTCATPHVSRSCGFWDVGCIQDTQERSYFQAFWGDTPTAAVCSPVTFEDETLVTFPILRTIRKLKKKHMVLTIFCNVWQKNLTLILLTFSRKFTDVKSLLSTKNFTP